MVVDIRDKRVAMGVSSRWLRVGGIISRLSLRGIFERLRLTAECLYDIDWVFYGMMISMRGVGIMVVRYVRYHVSRVQMPNLKMFDLD